MSVGETTHLVHQFSRVDRDGVDEPVSFPKEGAKTQHRFRRKDARVSERFCVGLRQRIECSAWKRICSGPGAKLPVRQTRRVTAANLALMLLSSWTESCGGG